jgi:uncharacterized protein (DUF305 family)
MPSSRIAHAALVAAIALQPVVLSAQAPKTYTAADVSFIQGMIHHHAQAILIAGWAKSHGASASVQQLCDRIVVSQTDEITIFQRWLAQRGQATVDLNATHAMMPSMDPKAVMPGMLTDQQLAALDAARGDQFDQLFLQDMIQHHQGAITMVNDLFAVGSGEDETVYKFATDIYADQTTEIARMQKMLASIMFGTPPA